MNKKNDLWQFFLMLSALQFNKGIVLKPMPCICLNINFYPISILKNMSPITLSLYFASGGANLPTQIKYIREPFRARAREKKQIKDAYRTLEGVRRQYVKLYTK
jgi:hypothetical protein